MHRCNNLRCLSVDVKGKNYGCLSVSVNRIGKDLIASAIRIGEDLAASVHRIGQELSVQPYRISNTLSASTYRLGSLRVSCGTICSVNKETPYWMWYAGEILYWDNKEYIAI